MTPDLAQPRRSTLAEGFQRFFFSREIPFGMALVRISLPVVLLVEVLRRWAYARELYSTDGAIATLHSNFGIPDMLPELSAPWAVALFTALALLLVTSTIGWCTRFSLLGSCALYFYFSYMDTLSTVTKYSVISQHILLLLGLSDCGNIWSVDAWLAKRAGRPLETNVSIWPQRLVQILFGMIYFGAGITKMHTDGFFTGDQLVYWMMTVINNEHPLGDHLTRYPLFVSISCYTTFIWEIVFIFTVFQPKLKWWTLLIGTIFHVMTIFTLGLIIFPVIISASYLVFLNESEFRRIAAWGPFRAISSRFSQFSPVAAIESATPVVPAATRRFFGSQAAFAGVLVLVSVAGVAAEYQSDYYRERGPNGPLTLPEIAVEDVQRMFDGDHPIRQSDKLMAFDFGSELVGEHLIAPRTVYKLGDRFVAQASLNPPHEDMWLECTMCEATIDPQDDEGRLIPGRILYHTGQIVVRTALRANFFFTIDPGIAPGEYFLKLRSNNQEMARKRFTVVADPSAPIRSAAAQ